MILEPSLILATHNAHKVREVQEILAPHLPQGQVGRIIGAQSLGLDEPVEDGVTFAQNALIKARAVARATGMPAIADDSGLCVDVLGGSPGVFSARWCGHHGDDVANLHLLLAQLADVPQAYRAAQFHCAAVLVCADGREIVCEADMPGSLLFEPAGENGFGYDPIFRPEGLDVSSAQLSAAEKDAISHRGKAFRALAPAIAQELSALS